MHWSGGGAVLSVGWSWWRYALLRNWVSLRRARLPNLREAARCCRRHRVEFDSGAYHFHRECHAHPGIRAVLRVRFHRGIRCGGQHRGWISAIRLSPACSARRIFRGRRRDSRLSRSAALLPGVDGESRPTTMRPSSLRRRTARQRSAESRWARPLRPRSSGCGRTMGGTQPKSACRRPTQVSGGRRLPPSYRCWFHGSDSSSHWLCARRSRSGCPARTRSARGLRDGLCRSKGVRRDQ